MAQNNLPDILIFMSDQHTSCFSGFYGHNVDTPNMDELCREGVQFSECYTSNPLCGPARMSMLSGIRSAKSGLFHRSTMADTTPTFLYYLVNAGYETTLIGRMHFIGRDQYHGFIKHIGGDMTPVTYDYNFAKDKMAKERGVFAQTDTFSGHGATSISGGGKSPVLSYDDYVVKTALDYLKEGHDKPQCIFVSIYGPHFPYVAPKELYLKYLKQVNLPNSFTDTVPCEFLERFQSDVSEKVAKSCLAAYKGMIEKVDGQFGEIKAQFDRFVSQRGNKKVIGYISDHGDQCGDRKMYGKETFYEKSVKVPLILSGDGIVKNYICKTPVSIMDLGPTLLDFVGADSMEKTTDGRSLLPALHGQSVKDIPVVSEYMYRLDGRPMFSPDKDDTEYCHGVMIRLGHFKYITYQGYENKDCLFDIDNDPDEIKNLAETFPDELEKFRLIANKLCLHESAQKNFLHQSKVEQLMRCYERAEGNPDQSLRWNGNPPDASVFPEICVKNPVFFKAGHSSKILPQK